jgi:outer membrane lipoprotein-sorting protein
MLSVEEIVNKTNEAAYYFGKDGRARVLMSIKDKQGRVREKEFVILRKDKEDLKQLFYVYFERPADVRKMAFLVWKNVEKDDDRWLYLPSLDLVKRIAASDKRTSFAGSDFFYEDISGRSIAEDDHTVEKETGDHYLLKNVPKNPEKAEFSFFLMQIDKKTFIPVKVEYFNQQGKLYRVYEALKVKEVQGYPTVIRSIMKDLDTGSATTIEFKNIEYDIGLNDDIFTERYLRRPPRKWLKMRP